MGVCKNMPMRFFIADDNRRRMVEEGLSAINAYREQATMKDYPGRMSAIMFTPGCNFRCGFCHNAGLFSARKTYAWSELEGILKRFRKQWISSVVITGGEPTIHSNLPETIRFIKKMGFSVKLDTNGSNPDMLLEMIRDVDYVAMDIKCSRERYLELAGWENTAVLDTSVDIILTKAKQYEFRTTVIEGIHTDEEMRACAEMIKDAKRYVLQPFVPHDDIPSVEMRSMARTRLSFLHHALDIVRETIPTAFIRGE